MSDLLEIVQAKLQGKIGEALLSAEQHQDFPVFIVAKDALKDTLRFLKEDPDMGFHFLTTMCGIHYPELPAEQEFWIMYQLHDMPRNRRIRVKAFMSRGDMDVPTVTDLWPSANWMERQEYDFFGFHFTGHPNLARILNMDEMNYFPMRKEYPLEDLQRDDKTDKYFGR